MSSNIVKELVSVVIPCYNSHKYLLRAINSIKNQEYKNFEIILVNDGSDNKETLDLINSLKEIKIINHKNLGLSAARNSGMKNSSGEFILFLDSDDWWKPSKLEITYNFIKKGYY